jgi:hypothetical protein
MNVELKSIVSANIFRSISVDLSDEFKPSVSIKIVMSSSFSLLSKMG